MIIGNKQKIAFEFEIHSFIKCHNKHIEPTQVIMEVNEFENLLQNFMDEFREHSPFDLKTVWQM